jgi:Tol biopolymer transport system component
VSRYDVAPGASASRSLILLSLLAAGAAAAVFRAPRPPAPDATRLSWIATAHQFGPVGYRDPAGAISPDGTWIAYAEGRFLRMQAVGGGPIVELPAGEAQIRNLSWHPDSHTILSDGFDTPNGWGLYDSVAGTRRRIWRDRDDVRQATWSPDGRSIAGIVNGRDGQEVWAFDTDGKGTRVATPAGRVSFPAWTPRGEIACIATIDGRPRVTVPCGGAVVRTDPDLDAYGPIAFAPDGATVYLALANAGGTVDLWAAPVASGRARRLTSFSRDSYAPSVTSAGALVFKVQSYRTSVAVAPAEGGPTASLATFQSETPSWDPTGRWLGITYGTWRRVLDDAKYPDIAQDAGIIAVDPSQPATAPARTVHDSASEDQSLCWSPNGRWIAFHSHKDQSDDIWLRPAEGNAEPRRISFLGRGAETGWPRWSPDGHWLLFDGANRTTHRSVIYVVGVDQETGAADRETHEIQMRGIDAEMSHAEWLPDSMHIAAIAKEAPGRHVIVTVARDGGDAHVVHRFASEHDAPGLAVSPDGRAVAFIAPAPDGFFQLFRMPLATPLAAGSPVQVTTDRSNKTQPAWSPDGRRIAFTVWSYDAQFWRLR